MGKLWEKGYELDKDVELFTVGNDYLLDQRLIPSDCAGSIAHAEGLAAIGVLSEGEKNEIQKILIEIVDLHSNNNFPIKREDEDGHTAIEHYLTKRLGGVGKKIHTGRSRNDQVLTAIRLYTKAYILKIIDAGISLLAQLKDFAKEHSKTPMPGRTHMQIAMPSSVGLWAAAIGESLMDDLSLLINAYHLNNRSPLGAAASYGVPLPLDRELVASILGFESVQNNVLYVNNSRGKLESVVIDSLEQIMLSFSRAAEDMILFSLPEFGYFTLPDELCSGSSIMPQKKNPDSLELLRAKSCKVGALNTLVKGIIRSLPSGYNRDLQETKEPLFNSLDIVFSSVKIMIKTIKHLKVNEHILLGSFPPEIYATDKVYQRVLEKGLSFRDAYKIVGTHLESIKEDDPVKVIEKRTSKGTSGNLCLDLIEEFHSKTVIWVKDENRKFINSMKTLFGKIVNLLVNI